MSLLLDLRFVDSISYLLRNFRKKADYLWNFSCPICGDSPTSKIKARGYIYRTERRDGLSYKCHKCSVSSSFSDLLKMLDGTVYQEYNLERFKESGGTPAAAPVEKVPFKKAKDYRPAKPTVLIGCPSIESLGDDHPAKKYIASRLIPASFYKELYWTDDFPALAKRVCPEHGYLRKEGRLVIPFLDRNFDLLAIQGRSLEPDAEVRYITIKAFEDAPRIYGMHRLGKTWQRIYILEGPFDSMFLPNALAMAGSDIPISLPVDKCLIVYDNEPHQKDTVAKNQKAIDKGYRVCIWPKEVKNLKDVNDMIKNGYKPEKIRALIDQNSYVGMVAMAKLQQWGKA